MSGSVESDAEVDEGLVGEFLSEYAGDVVGELGVSKAARFLRAWEQFKVAVK